MTGNQLQAARVLIGWSQATVAEAAGKISASSKAVNAIRSALDAQGLQFLNEGDTADGPGVVLVKK